MAESGTIIEQALSDADADSIVWILIIKTASISRKLLIWAHLEIHGDWLIYNLITLTVVAHVLEIDLIIDLPIEDAISAVKREVFTIRRHHDIRFHLIDVILNSFASYL